MSVSIDYRPSGFRALTPGLSVEGSARLLAFLERAFDARAADCSRNADGSIGHAALRIGDSVVEMSEARPKWPARPCAVHVYVHDADAWYRRAVDAGATTVREPVDEPYGDRAAALQDPCGNLWFLATRLSAGPVPAGFHTITPYVLATHADAVIAFMKDAFGATELQRVPKEGGGIMHAEVRMDDSMLEIADGGGEWPSRPCALHLYVPDADATWRRALAAGATPLYEPADMFYGDREGGVQDVSGNWWFIATHREDVSDAEIARRMAAVQA
jgi:PhnB protein